MRVALKKIDNGWYIMHDDVIHSGPCTTAMPLVLELLKTEDVYCVDPVTREVDYDFKKNTLPLDVPNFDSYNVGNLEAAIRLGALILVDQRGLMSRREWLGVNLALKMECRALYAWWLGKWRPISYYGGKLPVPSHKWVMAQLDRVMRVNCPLHPETKIIYHWTKKEEN